MIQDIETKIEEVFKNPKSIAEMQYDLTIKAFWMGEVKCYPASCVTDTVSALRKIWSEQCDKEYKQGFEDGKNWWKFWRKWK